MRSWHCEVGVCSLLGALLACSSTIPDGGTQPGTATVGGSSARAAGAPGSGASATAGKSGATAGKSGAAGKSGESGRGAAGSSAGTAGKGVGGGAAGSGTPAGAGATPGAGGKLEKFSFFVTSLEAMQRLSKNQNGFGGDLRYGQADGLSGADKICTEIAEASMPGAGAKGWHAFLSANAGPSGQPVHAIDRVGAGPWYDRLGRLLAMNKAALVGQRPSGADSAIVNDLPNEFGVPNHAPDPAKGPVDNHHVLTGSNEQGHVNGASSTCKDWTSTDAGAGRPRIGFSWPAGGRGHWISGQDEGGCGAGILLEDRGGSNPDNPIVGSGGGYGGIYCFAMTE